MTISQRQMARILLRETTWRPSVDEPAPHAYRTVIIFDTAVSHSQPCLTPRPIARGQPCWRTVRMLHSCFVRRIG